MITLWRFVSGGVCLIKSRVRVLKRSFQA